MCHTYIHKPKKGPLGNIFPRSVFRLGMFVFGVFHNCCQIGMHSPTVVDNSAEYLPACQVTGSWMHTAPQPYKAYLHSIWLSFLLPSVFLDTLLSLQTNTIITMKNDIRGIDENRCEGQYKKLNHKHEEN